jgi:hypothetical protein
VCRTGRLCAGSCYTYATDWITIKTRWNDTIDQTEQTTLTDILDGCPNTPVEITLAR